MSWIICEGIDRSGKSTLAEKYKQKGYKIIHMSAPDKKYVQPGYTGPSFLDEMVELIAKYDGLDVFFDRSWYGEISVWPHVYGRIPQLSNEDMEILIEFEEKNQVERLLLTDPNVEAHWQRCVANKEPLNKPQFNLAQILYAKMAEEYGFKVMNITDFVDIKNVKEDVSAAKEAPKDSVVGDTTAPTVVAVDLSKSGKTAEQLKLEQANAINDVLSKRIIRNKGDEYDSIETEVRTFLNSKLGILLGIPSSAVELTPDEIHILKTMAQRIKEKGTK